MTDQIRAPWTPEQVAALNRFQREGGMHPFTCGGEHAPGLPVLVARIDGWHCSDPYGEGCDYRQDWAHPFMADPDAWPQTPASAPVPAQDTPGGPGRQPDAPEPPQTAPDGFPDVQGRCPACGGSSLFVGSGGYITCRRIECPEPDAAATLLERDPWTTPDNPATSSDTADNPLRAESEAWRRKAVRRALAVSKLQGTIQAVTDLASEEITARTEWGVGYRAAIGDLQEVLREFGCIEPAVRSDGPREQQARPTHPDGTPYRYHEIVAEGWDFCDGCCMWTTATQEQPHQCARTHIHGPFAAKAGETP